MTLPILATKLFIPPPRAGLLPRSHLIEKLNQSAGYPLTLISASAGSGKTTVLSEWVATSDRPAAWISLDPGDNDPTQFLIYFVAAIRAIRDTFGEEALEILRSSQTVPFEVTLINLINEAAGIPDGFALILDDYHAITDRRTNELVTFLIEHLPPQMHLVVASRFDPPWPLARFRARNQLFEIRGRDLRFSGEEAAEFLNRTMGLDLSTEDVAALEERTEGWIAGLQLAAIAMQSLISIQGRADVPEFVKAFAGSHLYVAEYLVEEILKGQPGEVQSFLLQTSILERLNAGLCEAVSGCDDGQAILTSLRRANLFVIPLDVEGRWFRYHHLFADLLQSRLPKALTGGEIAALHRRASAWYEGHGFAFDAVNHALAAEDFERVTDLVSRAAHTLIFTGRVNVLRGWLEALPEASFHAHPHLTFYQFWIDVLQGRADLSEQAIREKEDLLRELPSSPENDRLRGELMAVVCRATALSGRTASGIRLAQEALAYLPPDDLASRARVNSALAIAQDLEGRGEEAEAAYRACFSQAIAAGDYRLAAHTTMAKGLVQVHYGRLHEAARTFQTIIEMGDRADIPPADQPGPVPAEGARARGVFFPAGQGHIGLGSIYLEWNDLETAEDHLRRGMELVRRGGLDGLFIGRIQMSRLRQAQGDLEGALEQVRLSKQASQRVDDFRVATRQIQIGLARGDVEGAWRWAAPLAGMLGGDSAAVRLPLLFLEALEAVVVRVYLAQGEIGKALALLDRLQATAEPAGRVERLIEVYLLRALAYQEQNSGSPTPEAVESIERALELGGPEGYVLLFLEEGPRVIALLSAGVQRSATPTELKDYARKLLDAFGAVDRPAAPRSAGEAAGLVERLTPREMEVLALIAAGDSNQAIADKLFITVRTVKKHSSNIYGKLNASGRTHAVARARELGLLPTDR